MKYIIKYSIGGATGSPLSSLPPGMLLQILLPLSMRDIDNTCKLQKNICAEIDWRRILIEKNIPEQAITLADTQKFNLVCSTNNSHTNNFTQIFNCICFFKYMSKLKKSDENIHDAVYLWLTDETAAIARYGHISHWDVSTVTDMRWTFDSATEFNEDLSSWDVSAVTKMDCMFHGATAFNGDLSSWDVSAVTDIDGMFSATTVFNGDLSSWNVSAVTSMEYMFNSATAFNGDLSSWDVSAVTDMEHVFTGATALQIIPPWYIL